MINYNWNIPALNCIVNQDGLTNVVKGIHWRYIGIDENNSTSELIGYQEIGQANSENFTPYSGLTLETVCEWLAPYVNISEMEATIAEKIAEKVSPIEIILPLPINNILVPNLPTDN